MSGLGGFRVLKEKRGKKMPQSVLDSKEKQIITGVVLIASYLIFGEGVIAVQFLQLGIGLLLMGVSPEESFDAINEIRGRNITRRNSIAPWRVIYGKIRLGGVTTFMHLTGTNREFLNSVVTLTGHEVDDIGDATLISGGSYVPSIIYFNDVAVRLDSNGDALPPIKKVTFNPDDVDTVTNKILITGHGLRTNMRGKFTSFNDARTVQQGTPPQNFVDERNYFVQVIDDDNIAIRRVYNTTAVPTGNNMNFIDQGTDLSTPSGNARTSYRNREC